MVHNFRQVMCDLIAEAQSEGITDPVIIYLDEKCSQARAIYQKMHRRHMQPQPIGINMFGATEKASRSDAIQLLHRHCSQAGTFLGAMLQRPVPSEFTTVWLLE